MIITEEVSLKNGNKIMIINYKGEGDPVHNISKFIRENVNHKDYDYTEFVDMDMDNPWVRIIVIGNDTKNIISK